MGKKITDIKKDRLDELLQNKEIISVFEEKIIHLIDNEKRITKKALAELTKLERYDVNVLFDHYYNKKNARVDLRCSIVDKLLWTKKAKKLNENLSDFLSQSINSTNIYIPRVEQLRTELAELVQERVKFVKNIELLGNCVLSSKTIEAAHILAKLDDIQNLFIAHDRYVMERVDRKYVKDCLTQYVYTDGEHIWMDD